MKRAQISTLAIACLIALVFVPAQALALPITTASYDDGDDYYFESYFEKEDLKGIDIGLAHASKNSLPLRLDFSAYEEDWFDDAVKITVSVKKPGKKFQKFKSIRYDEEFEFDDEDEAFYDFTVSNLKPNTKYIVKVDCKTTKYKYKRSFKRTFWTAFNYFTGKKAAKRGSKYSWGRVKGAEGYVARYRKSIYLGKNKYGTNMWKCKYAAKIVTNPGVTLASKYELTDIIPIKRHNGHYYIHRLNPMKSKAKVMNRFKMTTGILYT